MTSDILLQPSTLSSYSELTTDLNKLTVVTNC